MEKRMPCQSFVAHTWEEVWGEVSAECWFLGHKVGGGYPLEGKLCRSSGNT